jgi:C1A family cysteine protease
MLSTPAKYAVRAESPDWRDLPYEPKVQPLQDHVDLRKWAPPVEDQGHLGSCTGNAVVGAYELLTRKQSPERFQDLSRLFVYYNSRLIENSTGQDTGAYIRDSIKSMRFYGLCAESIWPYNIENFAVTPSVSCYQDAGSRNIKNYYRVGALEHSLQALSQGIPVVFSLRVYSGFELMENTDSLIPEPDPSEEPIGGHAMVMVGYDLARQTVLCRNSFGSDWCDHGHCWMSFDYARKEIMDSWIFDIDLREVPHES